jgi:hypothetical protein
MAQKRTRSRRTLSPRPRDDEGRSRRSNECESPERGDPSLPDQVDADRVIKALPDHGLPFGVVGRDGVGRNLDQPLQLWRCGERTAECQLVYESVELTPVNGDRSRLGVRVPGLNGSLERLPARASLLRSPTALQPRATQLPLGKRESASPASPPWIPQMIASAFNSEPPFKPDRERG